MKKLIASAALLAGVTSAGLALAPAASALDTGGQYNQCSGLHDGSTCWSQEHGVFQHLDLDGLEMGYKHN